MQKLKVKLKTQSESEIKRHSECRMFDVQTTRRQRIKASVIFTSKKKKRSKKKSFQHEAVWLQTNSRKSCLQSKEGTDRSSRKWNKQKVHEKWKVAARIEERGMNGDDGVGSCRAGRFFFSEMFFFAAVKMLPLATCCLVPELLEVARLQKFEL